jgi:hypothetical protein
MKMPKIPTWGWALLVIAVVYYVFLREGVDATLKKAAEPTPVQGIMKAKTD